MKICEGKKISFEAGRSLVLKETKGHAPKMSFSSFFRRWASVIREHFSWFFATRFREDMKKEVKSRISPLRAKLKCANTHWNPHRFPKITTKLLQENSSRRKFLWHWDHLSCFFGQSVIEPVLFSHRLRNRNFFSPRSKNFRWSSEFSHCLQKKDMLWFLCSFVGMIITFCCKLNKNQLYNDIHRRRRLGCGLLQTYKNGHASLSFLLLNTKQVNWRAVTLKTISVLLVVRILQIIRALLHGCI